jgi:4-amino-4-deoxy-L-arabinose transferase-like glycosyltransferase
MMIPEQLKKRKWELLLLGAIVLAGIFLRTYEFHDWLQFESDQARDAFAAGEVVAGEKPWPLLGPTMRASGNTEETLFRIGPAYYFLQILSATVFGVSAAAMAYPDALFGILSIPLFYFFLRRYFGVAVSLSLVGLYAVSFFAVRYSRFAWNPNLTPFFVTLFLASTHEFLVRKEKTSWLWALALGTALGIGVQLHAILLLVLSLVSVVIGAYLLMRNRSVWKKLCIALLLALFLNGPQLVSEWQTGFANSRALLHSPVQEGQSGKKSVPSIVADTVSCHIEAHAYLLSSLGQETCRYTYVKLLSQNRAGNTLRETASWPMIVGVLLFSVFGSLFLGYRFQREKDPGKRNFLGLIGVFSIIFFVVMVPVIGSDFKEFRHFSPIFAVPYVMLGLGLDFLLRRRGKRYFLVVGGIVIAVMVANGSSLYHMVTRLSDHTASDGHTVFFGEAADVVRYMEQTAGSPEEVYLMGDKIYSGNFFLSGSFIARQHGYRLIKAPSLDDVPRGAPLFFIAKNRGDGFDAEIYGIAVRSAKNFGVMRVYELDY